MMLANLWHDLRLGMHRWMQQLLLAPIAVATLASSAGFTQGKPTMIALENLNEMSARNVKLERVTYKGRNALRVSDTAPASAGTGERLVILNKPEFQDGMIEIELAGEPQSDAGADARGFVGVAFRVSPSAGEAALQYECFFLRPTNGRAEDQVRRNHATQFMSLPEFPWNRLRKEFPGQYESYADLVPGEWTKLKVEVQGEQARLYVQDAPQPVLVVNDLKHGHNQGQIALWIGPGTVAHFAQLRISK